MRPTIKTALLAILATTALLAAGPPPPALAAAAGMPGLAAVHSLSQVITNITIWLGGMLGGLATLFFIIGGLQYVIANGNPGEVMKAKESLKYAAIGYCTALLAPVLLIILNGFVGR